MKFKKKYYSKKIAIKKNGTKLERLKNHRGEIENHL